MCAPCKVVINEENGRAAALANRLRELMLQHACVDDPAGLTHLPPEVDDPMYALAECEVEHILAVRKHTVEHLEAISVPERWLALVKKVI